MEIKEKKYWADWFSNNIPTWNKIFEKSELIGRENLTFLEIGCFEGRATNYLLNSVLFNKGCKIHVVDTFEGSYDEAGMSWDKEYDFNSVYDRFLYNTSENREKVVIHRGESGRILRKDFVEDSFDFIYVDGSHTAPDVLQDAVLMHPLLKVGGIVIFDDFGWKDPKNLDPTNSPEMAINFFYAAYRHKYDVVSHGYQVALLKKSN